MFRSKYRKRHDSLILLVALLLFITVGYALISTNLNILGTTNISASSWNVHWSNLVVTSGSVTDDNVTTAAFIKTGNTEVEFSVRLDKPGDYYEFTVDAVNEGSIDAMIQAFSNKVYQSNGTTERKLRSGEYTPGRRTGNRHHPDCR